VPRILVVDDDTDARDLTVRWLHTDGHEVLAAGSGPVALDLVAVHGPPDVAVLDLDMPGMDGIELLSRLRQRTPYLPAAFLTVLWSGPDIARIRATGATYVAKPFTAAVLRAAVRHLLPEPRAEATLGGI
jgi:CheY-like chemotaxis protein